MRDRGIIVLSDGLKRCTITCCWFDEDGSAAGFLPEPVDSHRVVRRCAVPKDALKCHESLYLGFTCDVAEDQMLATLRHRSNTRRGPALLAQGSVRPRRVRRQGARISHHS